MPHSTRNETAYVTLIGPAARTASGTGAVIDGFSPYEKARVQLNVTAASGTSPTLDVVVEDTIDGTNWNAVGTFTQAVAAGRQVVTLSEPFTNQLRVRFTLGGTSPSFTFGVIGYFD